MLLLLNCPQIRLHFIVDRVSCGTPCVTNAPVQSAGALPLQDRARAALIKPKQFMIAVTTTTFCNFLDYGPVNYYIRVYCDNT